MALFNSAMFGAPGGGILGTGYDFQMPEWAKTAIPGALAAANPMSALSRAIVEGGPDAAKWLGSQFFVPSQNQPPAFAQGGGGGGWGDGPAPQAVQPAPQAQAAPSWVQSPAQAAQGMAAADNSFQWGNQTYPMYGGPAMAQADPAALPPNAMPTAGRSPMPQGPINPQAAAPAAQSQLLAPAPQSASDKWNDFLGRLNPEIGARNDAKKAQAETARGMYELLVSQNVPEKRAAAIAVMAARNPKILEEYIKVPTTIEGSEARKEMFGTGGASSPAPAAAAGPPSAGNPYSPPGSPYPALTNIAQAKQQGELNAKQADENARKVAVAPRVKSGLENLLKMADKYDDTSFNNSVGPIQGATPDGIVSGGIIGAARLGGEALNKLGGGKFNPNEVRSNIQGSTEALAAAIKPLIRAPGEGAWTDQDQARLVAIVGDLAQASNKTEFKRRLNDVRDRIESNFGFKVDFDAKPNVRTMPNGVTIEKIR